MTKAKTATTTPAAKKVAAAPAKKVIVGKKVATKQVDTNKLDQVLASQGPIIATAPAKSTPAKKTVKGQMSSKGSSKMEIATEIYLANPAAGRGELITLFMEKAGLTKMGASTYVNLIRKKHK